jgi:hypothetical protein
MSVTPPISLRSDRLVVLSRIHARNNITCLYNMLKFAGVELLVLSISCEMFDGLTSVFKYTDPLCKTRSDRTLFGR